MIQKTAFPSITAALRYPFNGKGWFSRILPLALVQLIPVMGQLILIGYGMEVARSVHAGQTDLPSIRWLKAVRDGGIFVLTGLLYITPLLAILPVILTVGTNQPTGAEDGTMGIAVSF